MKAVVYEKYGSPEMLELRDVATPVPGDHEVLVRVHAVSVNDWDWGKLLGSTLLDRMPCGLFKPRRTILGSDIAGWIEAVGKDVTRFKPGDEVFADLSGTWGGVAEYACAAETALAVIDTLRTLDEVPEAMRYFGAGRHQGKLVNTLE